MHPVIYHLLSRRGQEVPVADGRTINLVLFGGLMTSVRSAGAMIALTELGLARAFDNIYAVSAGFANASYFLSGRSREGAAAYYEDLGGRHFLNPWRFWNVVNIGHVMEIARTRKPLHLPSIFEARTKLWVRLRQQDSRRIRYLEVHDYPPEEYPAILEAAISIPYLNPGARTIGGTRYMDPHISYPGVLAHFKDALAAPGTDVLVLYNHRAQYDYIHCFQPELSGVGKNVLELLPPPDSRLSRWELRARLLQSAALEMGTRVKQEFGSSEPVNL